MSPRYDKAEVLSRVNFGALFAELVPGFRPKGVNSIAPCPFHEDKTPSMSCNVEDGLWHCFSCEAKGDAFELVQKRLGMDFKAALEWLGTWSGSPPSGPQAIVRESKPRARRPIAGIHDRTADGSLKVAEYVYGDRFVKVRYQHPESGKKTFMWFERAGSQWLTGLGGAFPGLYARGDLSLAVVFGEDIWLHEGEKAADRFALAGIGKATWPVAVCGPNGSSSFSKAAAPALAALLDGAARVTVVVDRDNAGRQWAIDVKHALSGRVSNLEFVQTPIGDGDHSKTDAFDHFEAGLGLEDFRPVDIKLIERGTPEASPATQNGGQSKDLPVNENLTDLGNCRIMAKLHGDDIRFVPGIGFLVWRDGRWDRDTDGAAERHAKEVPAQIEQIAWLQSEPQRRDECLKWAKRSEGIQRIRSMLDLLKSEPGITVPARMLDAGPWLVNTPTGTFDLNTGVIRDHDRLDLCTKWTRTQYDKGAKCPQFIAFLEKVMDGDQELISFLQRAIGYSLTGSTREQKLFLCHGTGANGKSTLIDSIRRAFGDYSATAQFESFCERDRNNSAGATEDIARLAGARFVSATEGGESSRLNEGLIKQLTGEDPVAASYKYGAIFEYQPAYKLWLSTNHKPQIRGTDEGIWRRVMLIPFDVRVSEQDRDLDLRSKLASESPGILAWAIQGALDWMANGLNPPDRVMAATTLYRTEMDVVGQFLEDCCDFDRMYSTSAGVLYGAYKTWCDLNGHRPLSQINLAKRMQERGFESYRSAGGNRERMWKGLIVAVQPGGAQPIQGVLDDPVIFSRRKERNYEQD